MSLFRFPWFSKIWYYNGKEKMPKVKMKAGYFLGFADHVGDNFTYQVLPEAFLKRPRGRKLHLHRSVIRLRNSGDDPPLVEEKGSTLKFFASNGKELSGDKLLEKQDMDVNDTVDDSSNSSSVDINDNTSLQSEKSIQSSNLFYSKVPISETLKEMNVTCPPEEIDIPVSGKDVDPVTDGSQDNNGNGGVDLPTITQSQDTVASVDDDSVASDLESSNNDVCVLI